MEIHAWLSDEENMEMNRRENPEAFAEMDAALEKIKKSANKNRTKDT